MFDHFNRALDTTNPEVTRRLAQLQERYTPAQALDLLCDQLLFDLDTGLLPASIQVVIDIDRQAIIFGTADSAALHLLDEPDD